MQRVKVAIIGAGSAGLSAFKEVLKFTDDVVIIDHGPLGTTCARVGCMPSKALIQIANDYHRRQQLASLGIQHGEKLRLDIPVALAHVRELRDYFVNAVLKGIADKQHHFICGEACFIEPTVIAVNDQKIRAERVIIATGSHAIIPPAWQDFSQHVLTSENLFEQMSLPNKLAVIGTGVIGLELGQALARFGLDVAAFGAHDFIGGLTDPAVNTMAIKILSAEMRLYLGERAQVDCQQNGNRLTISSAKEAFIAEKLLAAIGRAPNLSSLGIEQVGIKLNDNNMLDFDRETMQVANTPWFIAGDVNKQRPLLHEAADEGRIAGYNAVRDKTQCFQRRVSMAITFTQPNIAMVGASYEQLVQSKREFVIGEVDFSDQGRSRVKAENSGCLRVYVDGSTAKLLGAEMIAPAGEHLAHLLAWAIQQSMDVFQILQMPYYHPVIEEGMRTALRDAAAKLVTSHSNFELAICDSAPLSGLD